MAEKGYTGLGHGSYRLTIRTSLAEAITPGVRNDLLTVDGEIVLVVKAANYYMNGVACFTWC